MDRAFVLFMGLFCVYCFFSEEKLPYSNYTSSFINNADYNVYFQYPEAYQEKYDVDGAFIGQAKGLQQCARVAEREIYNISSAFGSESNLPGWGYVCCLRTKNSQCEEKHR